MAKIIPRHIANSVTLDFEDIDAVFINGPRQAGKSTFTESFAQSYKKTEYITFDDITARGAETVSPGSSFESITEGLVILDEIQLVPNSFLALKQKIDKARRKKENVKFLLTGSADIKLFPKLSEALVGRMYIRTLFPFSTAEIFETRGDFLQKIFCSPPDITRLCSKFNFLTAVSGATFPKLSLDIKNKTQWCQSYITALLERDVKNISDIDKIEILPQLLSVLASRAGSLLNEADLAGAVKISQPTLKRYRTLLDGIFLTFLVPPWFKNLEKRFVKSPKIYFGDTLLLCHLLGLLPEEVKTVRPETYGFILENFIAVELKKQLSLMDDGKLFHLRTSDLKEIDFIVEKRNGDILAIEVKAAKTVVPDDFKHILFLQKSIDRKFIRGIVLYTGDKIVEFGKDLYAIPVTALWENIFP